MKLSKVLSLVLAIAMLLSMPTFAAFNDVKGTENYAEAVTVLSALEIINGYEDGSFRPDGKITRAEYAAIICRVIGMGDAAKGSITNAFTDVPADHWANGYIATAESAGIINGFEDGTFRPGDEVTYEQAVKMLVCALGYEKKAAALGGWPTGYMMVAIQESITVGTNNAPGGAARSTVARLTYNSLTVPMMDQTSWGSEEKFEPIATQSLLWSKLDAVKAEVKIASVPLSKDATDVTLEPVGSATIETAVDKVAKANGYTLPGTAKINGVDLAGKQGLTATVILDKSDDAETNLVCVVSKSGKNVEVVIDPSMLANKNNGGYVEYYKTNDDDRVSKIKLENATPNTYVNLVASNYVDGVAVGGNEGDVSYRYVDTDNNGSYDTVFVDNETVFVVGDIVAKSNKIYVADTDVEATFDDAVLTLDPENDTVSWSIKDTEGNALGFADIKTGDVLAVKVSVADATYYDITVSNKTIEGTVTETFEETAKVGGDTVNKFKVDGTVYTRLDGETINPGSEITAKVYGDKIVDFTIAKGIQNFGMILLANRAEDFGVTYQLQILTAEGEVATYDFAEKVNGATMNYGSSDALKAVYSTGALIAYELNKKGEIKTIDVQNVGNVLADAGDRYAADVDGQYKVTAEKLDSFFITDNTVVFTTEYTADNANFGKENVAVANKAIFAEDIAYNYALFADSDKEALAVILYAAEGNVDFNTYPIAITKTASVTVEGERRTKLFGYVNGEETEIIVAENADNTVMDVNNCRLGVGDIVLYTTNAAGEMTKAFVLADKTANDYIVLNNAYNNVTGTGAEEDEDGEVATTSVNFSLTNGTFTTGAVVPGFKGFAVAGKAYRVQNNLLRIISAADYANITVNADGEKVYDVAEEGDELLINDFTVSGSAVAYQYNKVTGKLSVTTLKGADTEYNTKDYDNADQNENDDLVFAVNYDGATKLVLIVDVEGDN